MGAWDPCKYCGYTIDGTQDDDWHDVRICALKDALNKEWALGVDAAIQTVEARLKHYEQYRTGDSMQTRPATFAVLEEILILLRAMKQRGKGIKQVDTTDV